MVRRLVRMVAAALLLSVGAIALIGRLGRDWEARIAVRGHSMEPTLFDGDWLLVDPNAYVNRSPRPGELVVVKDPRDRSRILVKRALEAEGALMLGSDHAAHADDRIGPVSHADLIGRPWFRYWPMERMDRVS